jgi:hypothetical protein
MIEKIRRNRMHTMSTFVIAGIDANKAFTTTLSPSFLEIIQRGRRAQIAQRALRLLSVLVSTDELKENPKSTRLHITTVKSSIFHALHI